MALARRFPNQISRELEGASRNINQLARAANQALLGFGAVPEVEVMIAAAKRINGLGLEALQIMRMWR